MRADLTAIDKPAGVTFDQAGHLYVSEQGTSLAGSARQIRRVDAQTGIISLFAGGGTLTADDVGASEADITPGALITTSAGDILFADVPFGNARVRKIEALTGSVTTVAGGGDSIADDGPATLARLRSIRQIALDLEGNLYIADSVDNRIRRVDADTQLITTVAGTGERGLSGDGGVATLARLASPSGLVVDPGGNLFVADSENNRIRHVDAVTGTITTIAQLTSRPGYLLLDDAGTLFVALPSGIGAVPGAIGAVSATVSTLPFRPTGDALQTFPTARALALDSAGNLVIADGQNNRVRAVRAPIP